MSQIFTWNTSYSARNQPILIRPNGCAEQLFSNIYSTGMYTFGPIVTGIRNNDDLQLNHDVISWMGASFSVGGLCGALSAGKTIFILQYFCFYFYFQLLSLKWKYSKEWSRRVFIFITLFSRSMLILCQHIIHCIHSTYLYMIL